MRRRDAALVLVIGLLAGAAGVLACGSKTGLPLPGDANGASAGDGGGGGKGHADGAVVIPPDASLPIIDARPPREASLDLCVDASATLIYLVTTSNALLRFDPTTSSFHTIGVLACPDNRSPFSMAVDRDGIAYVLYATAQDVVPGSIFRVSTANASCEQTAFVPGQSLFLNFGMGFSANDTDINETLFVASDDTSSVLATIDPTSFDMKEVAPINPSVTRPELTGTGDGRLFGFYANPAGGSTIGEFDKTTATVTHETQVPSVEQGQAWAFGFWGGNFYLFTAPGSETIVTRVTPGGDATQVASYPDLIVGAGVSTCAPAQ